MVTSAQTASPTSWVDAPKEHKLGLCDGKIVCMNPKGKQLASVPSWMKEDPVFEQLQALVAWLDEHEIECLHTVERWMLRSLIVPRDVVINVWPDLSWRAALENMVIAAADKSGKINFDQLGILRDVDAKRGLGIVDLDGESKWLKSPAVAVPHPILIDELDDLRDLITDLGNQQPIEQLYRPVYQPTDEQSALTSIREYSGGVFEQLNFALGVCRRLGYPVRGGYATCKVWEGLDPFEARYYVGADFPESETETGDLIFVNKTQQAVAIRDVGPVTYSEGVRMANAIYAKRKVDKQESSES